jgi:hypothetical protein
MLLARSVLGASPPQNVCSLALVPFGGIVIRHGPYPPPPLCGNQNSVKAPSPNAGHFFTQGR